MKPRIRIRTISSINFTTFTILNGLIDGEPIRSRPFGSMDILWDVVKNTPNLTFK